MTDFERDGFTTPLISVKGFLSSLRVLSKMEKLLKTGEAGERVAGGSAGTEARMQIGRAGASHDS
jgi:hypothetical protein